MSEGPRCLLLHLPWPFSTAWRSCVGNVGGSAQFRDGIVALARVVGPVGGDAGDLPIGRTLAEQFGQQGGVDYIMIRQQAPAPMGSPIRWPPFSAPLMPTLTDDYNNSYYRESIGNLIPACVFFGRNEAILAERKRVK